MKNIIKLIFPIFLLGLSNPTFSQAFWEQLYFPDSVSIQCLTTNELGHIFVGAGDNQETGGVYRSTDNAQSWKLVYNNANHSVKSIAINENGYLYIGKNGFSRFMISKDNGESWDEIDLLPPSYGSVEKILCIGQDTIFVSTWEDEGGFITRSFDGGDTWEGSFITDNPNEYASDIAISNTGEVFVSLSAFFVDMGGVFKSIDGGVIWEYVGLLNHQVMTIEINSNNDVFTGDWWVLDYNENPGIFAHYEGIGVFELIFDAVYATDIIINAENHIYATANEGVIRSFNNGLSFEYVNDELSNNLNMLHLGVENYLYAAKKKRLVKSINPITSVDANDSGRFSPKIRIYPNPVNTVLNVHMISLPNIEDCFEICIYDIVGKLVHKNEKSFVGNTFQLDVSNLLTGPYLLKMFSKNKEFEIKFIKK